MPTSPDIISPTPAKEGFGDLNSTRSLEQKSGGLGNEDICEINRRRFTLLSTSPMMNARHCPLTHSR